MNNVNSYNKAQFKKYFATTEIYQQLKKEFGYLNFEKFFVAPTMSTPRKFYYDRTLPFYPVSFYYLDYLLSKRPAQIYDLGCGWNFFKRYIPNIIGIGAEDPSSENFHGDLNDFVDQEFISGHQEYFESVFSINALNFQPITEFKNIVQGFYSMIAPNGRGYLALNLQRMVERTPESAIDTDWETYIRKSLVGLEINFLVVDIDFSQPNDVMDGNIRLVMEKS